MAWLRPFRPLLVMVSLIVLILAAGITVRSPEPATSGAPGTAPRRTASACQASPGDVVSEGVTSTAIRVATTVTLDSPGASLFDSAPVGMRAMVNRVNRAGGICGRRIELTTVNDSWDRDKSLAILRRFVAEDYFALVSVPSTDGLVAALEGGHIDAAGMPVVGTGGMADAEFSSSWVWPVGASASTTMGAIARDATARGARRFAIVRDAVHQFAHDGAAALRTQIERLGGRMAVEILLDPADGDLADESRQFELACGRGAGRCDGVVLLLAPSTALAWRAANPTGTAGRARAGGVTYGAPTLFTDDFARECAQWCDGMIVPTAYVPAIPPLDASPGVAMFSREVQAERLGIDVRNQVLQQSYLGMEIFVEAVRVCSPELTRACLRKTLNTFMFVTDLATPLRWDERNRQANTSVNGYLIRSAGGTFSGWAPMPGWRS